MRLLAFLLAGLAGPPAIAGESPWVETMGGRLRLVTADTISQEGILRGALQIRLAPGWKTYWKEPGETGIAPIVNPGASEAVRRVEILFPPPVRITDRYSSWAGYAGDVDLALEFHVARMPRIAGDVFLGLCETICVPVEARLEVPPQSVAGEAEIVAAAFSSLPQPAGPGFGVTAMRLDANRLEIEAVLPEGAQDAALFLVNPDG